jgi:hypothetical protein
MSTVWIASWFSSTTMNCLLVSIAHISISFKKEYFLLIHDMEYLWINRKRKNVQMPCYVWEYNVLALKTAPPCWSTSCLQISQQPGILFLYKETRAFCSLSIIVQLIRCTSKGILRSSLISLLEPPWCYVATKNWCFFLNEPKFGLGNRRKGSLEAILSRSGSSCP